MKNKSLILIVSIHILLQANLFSQDTLFLENYESYAFGPLADETESPWVQLEIGRNGNVSEYWVHSGNKNFQINSFTTKTEVDYVKFNMDKKPAQLNIVLWYTPDGYYVYEDFAEIGLSLVTSKFESKALVCFKGNDHKLYFADTVMAVEVFNELEYGVGPADFDLGTPKHNYIKAEFDFNNSEVRFFIDTDSDAPLRNTIEFDGTLDFNAMYIAGGLNPTYIDDICITTEGEYTQTGRIDELISNEQIKFYPNPASNILHFEGIDNEVTNISILSLDGKLLTQINEIGINQINVSYLQNGVYLIQIIKPDCILMKKFIKQSR
jgi:hypothetical protein